MSPPLPGKIWDGLRDGKVHPPPRRLERARRETAEITETPRRAAIGGQWAVFGRSMQGAEVSLTSAGFSLLGGEGVRRLAVPGVLVSGACRSGHSSAPHLSTRCRVSGWALGFGWCCLGGIQARPPQATLSEPCRGSAFSQSLRASFSLQCTSSLQRVPGHSSSTPQIPKSR